MTLDGFRSVCKKEGMARLLRVEFEGAVYHVMARGNEGRRIFRDNEDRQVFFSTLEQCIENYGLQVYGFCLMPNHYHVFVETPRENLSRAIGWEGKCVSTWLVRLATRMEVQSRRYSSVLKDNLKINRYLPLGSPSLKARLRQLCQVSRVDP